MPEVRIRFKKDQSISEKAEELRLAIKRTGKIRLDKILCEIKKATKNPNVDEVAQYNYIGRESLEFADSVLIIY